MAIQSPDALHELIRFTPRRRVWRVNSSLPVFVKQYVPCGWSGALKALLGRNEAAREWQRLRSAQSLGLPVPTPVGLGHRGKGVRTERFLVTESLNEAIPLGDFLFGPGRACAVDRWRAIRTAASLLRKVHDSGVRHEDLHLDNILTRKRGKEAEAFLIDMQRVKIGRPLNMAARVKSLATLHGGCLEASRTERLRFFQAYVRTLPNAPPDLWEFLAEIENRGRRHRLRLWQSRAKRCLRENREFMKLPSQKYLAFGRRCDWTAALQGLVRDPAGLLARSQIVKDSRTTTVGALTVSGRTIYLKRYNYQGVGYALKDVLRPARAKRVWKAANNCVMRDISVALPVAYIERRRSRVLRESYLATMAVEGEALSQMLAHCRDHFVRKRALIGELGRYVRRMHDRGVAHRDLKADNFVAREEEGGGYRFYIVDFDGFYLGSISWRRRIKNLVRLLGALRDCVTITRTDAARFLRSYLGRKNSQRFGKIYKEMAKRTRKALRPRATA